MIPTPTSTPIRTIELLPTHPGSMAETEPEHLYLLEVYSTTTDEPKFRAGPHWALAARLDAHGEAQLIAPAIGATAYLRFRAEGDEIVCVMTGWRSVVTAIAHVGMEGDAELSPDKHEALSR